MRNGPQGDAKSHAEGLSVCEIRQKLLSRCCFSIYTAPALTPEGNSSVNVKARMTIQGSTDLSWARVIQVIVITILVVLALVNEGVTPLI